MNILLKVLPWIVGAIMVLIFIAVSYVKAPPDTAYIISGIKRRVVIGKAFLRLPFLERFDKLTLRLMTVDVKTENFVPTNEYINVKVDGVVKVKIGTTEKALVKAAENFLNMNTHDIVLEIRDVLEGNMREIIGQMSLAQMVTDRKAFGERVQENAVPDLNKMGLDIISFNVQDFYDEQEVITNLGIDNISKIKKTAAIAKAEAEKEVAIAQAQADQEANNARVLADTDIAEKQNNLEVKKAELKQEVDRKKAAADMAYEIQKEQSRQSLEERTAEANNVKAKRQIEITQNNLDANIKKTADADRYRREAEATAELFERTKKAEAIKTEAEADAEAIRVRAEAEASGILAKSLAEAEGIDKKAEAMKKYEGPAVLEMFFKVLPELAANVASPLNNVDKITMFGEGNSTKLISDIINTVTKIEEGFGESLGIDIKDMIMKILTKDFSQNKTTKNPGTQSKESKE